MSSSATVCYVVQSCLTTMTIDLWCVSDHLTNLYGRTLLIEDTLVEGAYNNQGFKSEVGCISLQPGRVLLISVDEYNSNTQSSLNPLSNRCENPRSIKFQPSTSQARLNGETRRRSMYVFLWVGYHPMLTTARGFSP